MDFFARGYALGLQFAQLTFDKAFVFYDRAAIRLLLSVGHISVDVAADLLAHDPLPYRVVDGVCVAGLISPGDVDQISPGDVDQISPG